MEISNKTYDFIKITKKIKRNKLKNNLSFLSYSQYIYKTYNISICLFVDVMVIDD